MKESILACLLFCLCSGAYSYRSQPYYEWTRTTIDGKPCRGGLLYVSGFNSIHRWNQRVDKTLYSNKQYVRMLKNHRLYLDFSKRGN